MSAEARQLAEKLAARYGVPVESIQKIEVQVNGDAEDVGPNDYGG